MTTAPAAQCDRCGALALVVSDHGDPAVGAVPQAWYVVHGPTPDPGQVAVATKRRDYCSARCLADWATTQAYADIATKAPFVTEL